MNTAEQVSDEQILALLKNTNGPDGVPLIEWLEVPNKGDAENWGIATHGMGISDIRGEIHDEFHVKLARSLLAALSHVQAPAEEDALGYATRLVKIMAEKHYPDGSPDWKPLPDVVGILTQIDNMVSGMVRAPQIDEAMVERFKVAFQNPPDGKEVRDFTYDENVSRGLQAALGGGKQ